MFLTNPAIWRARYVSIYSDLSDCESDGQRADMPARHISQQIPGAEERLPWARNSVVSFTAIVIPTLHRKTIPKDLWTHRFHKQPYAVTFLWLVLRGERSSFYLTRNDCSLTIKIQEWKFQQQYENFILHFQHWSSLTLEFIYLYNFYLFMKYNI